LVYALNHSYVLSFRKAVLPIENDIHSESVNTNVGESHAEEGAEGTEEMITRMAQLQKGLFQSAKLNIGKAQDRYKRDYDMKHSNGKVSWHIKNCCPHSHCSYKTANSSWANGSVTQLPT
jgi:hypothetical protein